MYKSSQASSPHTIPYLHELSMHGLLFSSSTPRSLRKLPKDSHIFTVMESDPNQFPMRIPLRVPKVLLENKQLKPVLVRFDWGCVISEPIVLQRWRNKRCLLIFHRLLSYEFQQANGFICRFKKFLCSHIHCAVMSQSFMYWDNRFLYHSWCTQNSL